MVREKLTEVAWRTGDGAESAPFLPTSEMFWTIHRTLNDNDTNEQYTNNRFTDT